MSRILRSGWIDLPYRRGPAKKGESPLVAVRFLAIDDDICPGCPVEEDRDTDCRNHVPHPLCRFVMQTWTLTPWEMTYPNPSIIHILVSGVGTGTFDSTW